MIRSCWLVCLAAVLLGCSGASPSRETAVPAPGGRGEFQALLDRVREDLGAPGAILGVDAGKGRVELVASGLADREAGTLMDPGAPFFIGSITKTYTAVTVLRLAEEGRLSLSTTPSRASCLPSREGRRSPSATCSSRRAGSKTSTCTSITGRTGRR